MIPDDEADGCRVLVAPFDAAKTIESDALEGRGDAWTMLANIHDRHIVDLQCLFAGEDPQAPSIPAATRYNPFTRKHDTLTRADAVLAAWRGLVGGEWRTHADMAKMAEDGVLQGYGAIVFVAPDALVDALSNTSPTDGIAGRWCAVNDPADARTYEAALATLVRCARDAKKTAKSLFFVELI